MQPDTRRISSSCLPSEQARIGAANIAWTKLQLAEQTAANAYIDDDQLHQLLHKVQGIMT